MKMRGLLVFGVLAASVAAALAVQPGTTGTEKRFQEMAVRSAVITQKNNTATATAGAATLNSAGSGIITSEALTTIGGSDYTLTLTNNMIGAGDVVLASVQNGTNTAGALFLGPVQPAAGSVVITVRNGSGQGSLNGTIKIGFMVVKQSALGSD